MLGLMELSKLNMVMLFQTDSIFICLYKAGE